MSDTAPSRPRWQRVCGVVAAFLVGVTLPMVYAIAWAPPHARWTDHVIATAFINGCLIAVLIVAATFPL